MIVLIPSLDKKAPNFIASQLSEIYSCQIFYLKGYSSGCYFTDKKTFRLNIKNLINLKGETIHSHGFLPDVINVILRRLLFRGNKSITTIHSRIGDDLKESKGVFIGGLVEKIWLLCLNYFDKVVCVNKDIKSYLESRGVPSDKIEVIYNGILVSSPVSKKISSGKIRVVSWSVLRKMKGHQHVIKAVTEAMTYDLYGSGEYGDALKKLSSDKNNVALKGYAELSEIEFDDYDVFISLSEFEGSALSVMEAIDKGIPCVCSSIASFREHFTDEEVVFCNSNTSSDIVNAIEEAAVHGRKLSINARNKLLTHYSVDVMKEQYKSIYEKIE